MSSLVSSAKLNSAPLRMSNHHSIRMQMMMNLRKRRDESRRKIHVSLKKDTDKKIGEARPIEPFLNDNVPHSRFYEIGGSTIEKAKEIIADLKTKKEIEISLEVYHDSLPEDCYNPSFGHIGYQVYGSIGRSGVTGMLKKYVDKTEAKDVWSCKDAGPYCLIMQRKYEDYNTEIDEFEMVVEIYRVEFTFLKGG